MLSAVRDSGQKLDMCVISVPTRAPAAVVCEWSSAANVYHPNGLRRPRGRRGATGWRLNMNRSARYGARRGGTLFRCPFTARPPSHPGATGTDERVFPGFKRAAYAISARLWNALSRRRVCPWEIKRHRVMPRNRRRNYAGVGEGGGNGACVVCVGGRGLTGATAIGERRTAEIEPASAVSTTDYYSTVATFVLRTTNTATRPIYPDKM